jgi:enoyl-CoA hydratase/carnithine racemase
MHTEFRQVMAELEQRTDIWAVVVTGTPPAFCVGGDSKALTGHGERGGYDSGLTAASARPGGGYHLDADIVWQLGYRLRIIAAVQRSVRRYRAVAVLFWDLRFVAAEAELTTAAPKIGLLAQYGASWVLPRLIGVTRANDLLLSGRIVTGAETADWGLWNGVEPDGEATLAAAQRYARILAESTGPNAVAMTKRQIVRDLLRHGPAASVADSLRLLDDAMGTAEYREGVIALNEKRQPNF